MTTPVFEESTSPLTRSNDGKLVVLPVSQLLEGERGWTVSDYDDGHVELFTRKREVADAFVAGYDYARRTA